MSTSSAVITIRRAATGIALVGLTLLGTGCSSDDATTGPTTTAPEQKISSDADVAVGLAKMGVSSAAVAAASNPAAAISADDELEPVWTAIEGTVRQNEPTLYADIEASLSLLAAGAKGDGTKATTGADSMGTAIAAYVAKHPG